MRYPIRLQACCLFMLVFLTAQGAQAEQVLLADGGEAKLSIVVGRDADEKVQAAANDLADYLGRISGATFDVGQGDGGKGIVLGVPGDFAGLPFDLSFDDRPFHRDHYVIRSTANGLYLLGATPQAAEFAVWDLLHRVGYRYFFPSATWEIIPRHDRLSIDLDVREEPSYIDRSGPRGAMRLNHRTWALDGWEKWRVRNRTAPTFSLHTGHAYAAIIRRNQAAFDANPQFYAKHKGERADIGSGTKLCIGNADLRKLVVADAIAYFEAYPDADSTSLDPSDGGGWCGDDCELCAPLGSVSDRVVLLANEAAAALDAVYERPRYIGIYAYNEHSPPPTIQLHPHVIPSLATAFIRGGFTFEGMLEGWGAKAELIGIREYYGIPVWNSTLPGAARAGRIDYMARTIPDFHAAGARFMNGESDGAWGPNGLGYYLATRLLWDVGEAEHVDALVDDFLEKSFGEAQQPMRAYYQLIAGGRKPRLSNHLVGRMYRLIDEARAATTDEGALARINDLLLYTRHVELMRDYLAARGDDRQAALDAVMSHAWRIRATQMADTLGLMSYLNRTVRKKDGLAWGEGYTAIRAPDRLRVNEDKPFSESERSAIVREGIAANPTLSFEPIDFEAYLIPAAGIDVDDVGSFDAALRTRGRGVYYTWLTERTPNVRLTVTTGTIYNNRGAATVTLERWDEDGHDFVAGESHEVPPDEKPHDLVLRGTGPGLHRVVVDEQMTGTTVVWPADLPRVTPHGLDHDNHVVGRYHWYFYVPKGTRVIGAYARASGGYIADPAGEKVFNFEGESVRDYITIDVPEGQDGKLWQVRKLSGGIQFMTVPPYGFTDAANMLLPEDVVSADGR